VDAAHSYEPYTSEALNNGGRLLLTSADTSRWQIPSPFVFSEEMIKNQPEAARGFVAAFFEAVDWMYAHNDEEILAEVAKQFPDVPADYFWLGGDYVTTLADNKKLMQPGDDFNSIYFTANEYTNFLLENGILNSAPNLDELIDPAFLP
jgi:NitT/TauT family transport system substrate-binding protein